MKKSSFYRALLVTTVLATSGCQTLGLDTNTQTPVLGVVGQRDNGIQALVRKSTEALQDGKLKEASRYINLALKLDITNPDLQFLNGLTYHMMGVRGDASKFELAEQGYLEALKFDSGNLSARYQLGLLYMDQRRYNLAQGQFAAVALHRGQDAAVLYSLASASYYAHDPKTADAALKQLMKVSPEAMRRPDILKAVALTLSAMDDRDGASEYAAAYYKVVADKGEGDELQQRIANWQSFYDSDAKVIQAQFAGNPYAAQNPYAQRPDPYGQQANPYGANTGQSTGAGFADPSMVVVDVVLIGTQEDVREARGVNLLKGLQLQFGDPVAGTAGYSISRTRTKDNLASGLAQSTQTITRLISIPAVTYSLNIANSLDANNQVLAKPSLVAQNGETSEFFSGTEILAAAVSGGSGDSVSVQKEVGVKLSVKPEILPDDQIRLHVVAERTFLTDPSSSVVFEFRLDTTKTNVNSTVTMKFGETLVLGGLSERETSKTGDGVPLLKDIPVLNYLFSEKVKRQFERSVLILLTPRRPHYTRQAQADREGVEENMSDLEKDLKRLQQRNGDWYTPRPTFDIIKDKLQSDAFFEEFRAGDVQIQSWHKAVDSQSHIARVQKRLLRG